MTRFASAQAFIGPFSADGRASIAPSPPWHYAADFTTISAWAVPEAVAALLPPGLEVDPAVPGRMSVSFVDWQACTDGGDELLDPVRSQYRECIVLVSVVHEGRPMHYCPYVIVDQDTSLARGWALGYPKKLGSVWVTRQMGVSSIASPTTASGATFAGTVAVMDRRVAEGRVRLDRVSEGDVDRFGARPIAALRHFPSMLRGEHDHPSVLELVRLEAEDVVTSEVWEGEAHLTIHDSATEPIADLQPTRIGRGWRYSIAMTNRHNHLLRDLRAAPSLQEHA